MLTPQEVSERTFARAAFNGYNVGQVDEFLDVLTQDYTALYNENAVLKSKLKVLADKVEEYRSTEEAMRRALRAAQRQADEMLEEAKKEKTRILDEAKTDAKQKMDQVHEALAAEEFRLKQAQDTTSAFVAQVQALNAKQAEYLASIGELCPAVNPVQVENAAADINSSVQHILEQSAPEEPQDLEATAQFTPVTEEAQEAAEEAQEQTENTTEERPEELEYTRPIPFPAEHQD